MVYLIRENGMDKLIIGISGKQRSGKSLMASILELIYGYERIDLAKPLKVKLAKKLVDDNGGCLLLKEALDKIENQKDFYRPFLIDFGKKLKLEHGNDYLIKLGLKNSKNNKIIFENIKTKEEFDYIKSQNGIMVRIERSRELRNGICYSSEKDITETDLDDVKHDYTIINNSSEIYNYALKIITWYLYCEIEAGLKNDQI